MEVGCLRHSLSWGLGSGFSVHQTGVLVVVVDVEQTISCLCFVLGQELISTWRDLKASGSKAPLSERCFLVSSQNGSVVQADRPVGLLHLLGVLLHPEGSP